MTSDNLGTAFQRFFQGLGKYPKFKKKGINDSFTIDLGGQAIAVGGISLKLPTIGWVKTYEVLPDATTKSLTISRIADDWFISFCYSVETEITKKEYDIVGVDLGINQLATLSTGVVFSNSKHYKNNLAKLKRLSKKLTRKEKGSKRRYKARIKLAKHYAKITNSRKDTLHKATTYISKNHATIVVENLNVSGMLKNHKLAQAISDCSFYEFNRQLTYKSLKFGSKLITVDRWYPFSQICSNCGHQQKMPLCERTFNCENCGSSLDRDLNASRNLARQALACKLTEG